MPKQNPSSPNSVIGKVCSILAQFTLEKPHLSLDEITAGSGVPRTSTYRLLQSLIEQGFVSLSPAGYKLGLRLFQIGMVAQQTLKIDELLDDALQSLAQKIQETLIVATLDQVDILYLYVNQPANPLRYVAGVGQRRDARFGATGLALLACLSEEERQIFAKEPLPQYTAKTVTDREVWLQRLRQIADEGVVIDHSEYFEGIAAIAVPLKNKRPLALTIVGPEERIRLKEASILTEIQKAAKQLEMLPLV